MSAMGTCVELHGISALAPPNVSLAARPPAELRALQSKPPSVLAMKYNRDWSWASDPPQWDSEMGCSSELRRSGQGGSFGGLPSCKFPAMASSFRPCILVMQRREQARAGCRPVVLAIDAARPQEIIATEVRVLVQVLLPS
ncbi:hypothetical protein AK830_g844 [Neonectria ditissima]|uniref:Uncharacterized protein n=1 Tax=Neonectria ditissima TaxID=78410 RepID=A0A0P7BVC6_9HYPO|nr:hypothetical protein AK830_g844 [Neonectria ditissima]